MLSSLNHDDSAGYRERTWSFQFHSFDETNFIIFETGNDDSDREIGTRNYPLATKNTRIDL